MQDVYFKEFKGIKSRFEEESIGRGFAAGQTSNWVTKKDHIELRRGQVLMGTSNAGTGNISGLRKGVRFDGDEVLVKTYDRKIKYYNETTEDWVETTSANALAATASGEDIAIDTYQSLAGGYFYLSSKNSSIYKLPIANPASVVDLSSTSHRGKIRIKQNRTFLWDRKDSDGGFDATGLYGSYIDHDELADYDDEVAEVLGASGSTTYAGTLAFKGGGAKRTCMFVTITGTTGAGAETFRDNRDGVLVGSLGGTGTINYATGAYSVTFNGVVMAGNVTATYYWEDSTNEGIADFSYSGTRVAGEGFVFRQDDGGAAIQNIFSIGATEYSMHTLKTWGLTLSSDDTDATNLIYRNKVGIPNWRAGCETGDGIYYVDSTDPAYPVVRLLEIGYNNAEVVPRSISDDLDLSGYSFDLAHVFEWGNYICIACRTLSSTINDTLLLFDRTDKTWDKHDIRASVLENYNGGLVAGDSGSKNVFRVFSGLTDEESEIPNNWTSNKDRLGIEGIKYFNIFKVKGLIDPDQKLQVWFSYDRSNFVLVGTIDGQGNYVDHSTSIIVGANTLGLNEVGGGGDGIEANPYEREFRVSTPRFEDWQVMFVATQVGYVSVTEYACKDVRFKGRRISPQYSEA